MACGWQVSYASEGGSQLKQRQIADRRDRADSQIWIAQVRIRQP